MAAEKRRYLSYWDGIWKRSHLGEVFWAPPAATVLLQSDTMPSRVDISLRHVPAPLKIHTWLPGLTSGPWKDENFKEVGLGMSKVKEPRHFGRKVWWRHISWGIWRPCAWSMSGYKTKWLFKNNLVLLHVEVEAEMENTVTPSPASLLQKRPASEACKSFFFSSWAN